MYIIITFKNILKFSIFLCKLMEHTATQCSVLSIILLLPSYFSTINDQSAKEFSSSPTGASLMPGQV